MLLSFFSILSLLGISNTYGFIRLSLARRPSSYSLQSIASINDQPKSSKDVFSSGAGKFIPLFIATLAVAPVIVNAKGVGSPQENSYLSDPTDEFKADEARTKAFNTEQIQIKAKWDTLLKDFEQTSEADPDVTETKLKGLIQFLTPLNGNYR